MVAVSMTVAVLCALGAFVCWLADLPALARWLEDAEPQGNGKRTPSDPWEWEWTE